MEPSHNITRLLEIMQRLRDPKTGCAWDVEQDYASIAPYTVEEAYEVADAIERGDIADLTDELGDLLLQVVFHAQIGKDRDEFEFGDVVHAVTSKMIRRHPHVFGPEEARSMTMAKGQWDRIKQEEKAARRARLGEQQTSLLDDVPNALPAATIALKLQQKAARVGFDWSEPEPIFDKIEEETQELKNALKNEGPEAIKGEIGDLLFAVINLARHCDVEPEDALRKTNAKFRKRFAYIEKALGDTEKSMEDATLEEMEALWQAAKKPS